MVDKIKKSVKIRVILIHKLALHLWNLSFTHC